MTKRKLIPALHYRILTPLIDPFLNVLMKGAYVKSRLIDGLDLKGGERVLDFGCGTGTLALMIKKAKPDCAVTGIDIDPQALGIARDRALDLGITFVEYDGATLPFADRSFDRAVTSFVLHHLSATEKAVALKEIYRVLDQDGELHVLDIGVPGSGYARLVSSLLKRLEPVEDNLLGKIPEYLSGAGFVHAGALHSENTLLGTVAFYVAKKP